MNPHEMPEICMTAVKHHSVVCPTCSFLVLSFLKASRAAAGKNNVCHQPTPPHGPFQPRLAWPVLLLGISRARGWMRTQLFPARQCCSSPTREIEVLTSSRLLSPHGCACCASRESPLLKQASGKLSSTSEFHSN